jgi:hypothetical protein
MDLMITDVEPIFQAVECSVSHTYQQELGEREGWEVVRSIEQREGHTLHTTLFPLRQHVQPLLAESGGRYVRARGTALCSSW